MAQGQDSEREQADVPHPLSRFIEPESLELLAGTGADFIEQIGLDVIRDIILDVLTGKNLRDSTEAITRRRLSALNLAMLSLFLRGSASSPDFVSTMPRVASEMLARKRLSRSERWIAQWVLGLTDKAVQNVLRDDISLYESYTQRYIDACNEMIDHHRKIYGELSGTLHLDSGAEARIDWLFMVYLLNTIGSQTLTIRGSDKSLIGKLFEKLILGSLLSILGFQHVAPYQIGKGVFWLSSQDEKRESDATLLYDIGQGVRFDIGFIGRGNPEISLDKVTRFERETLIHGKPFYMATIILVDRIGRNSRIERMAEAVNGSIVQMSATYWPQRVAEILRNTLGFEHELADMSQNTIEDYLRDKLRAILIENFLKDVRIVGPSELEPSADENNAVEDDQSID